MGSDMFMESRNAPCPKASDLVLGLETQVEALRTRNGELSAEVSRLRNLQIGDAETIVRLTRERDTAVRERERIISG